jgi:hypothetical protein
VGKLCAVLRAGFLAILTIVAAGCDAGSTSTVDPAVPADLAAVGFEPPVDPQCEVGACPQPATPCQRAVCGPDNRCGFEANADGPLATQTAGDCRRLVCQSGVATSLVDDTDLPDDGSPCTDDACQNGTPQLINRPLGSPCGTAVRCDGMGKCVGCLSVSDCPVPASPCLTATCSAGSCQVVAKPDGTACDDGTACTRTDVCLAGVCTGTNPVVCRAISQCHLVGTCNPSDGVCSRPRVPSGTPCDDGNSCTVGDQCLADSCVPGTAKVCTALDACHDVGVCEPSTGICSDPPKQDGAQCDDGNACTQGDTCQSGACTPGSSTVCSTSNPCQNAGTCDPGTGICSSPSNKNDGTTCDSGIPCTTSSCMTGICMPRAAMPDQVFTLSNAAARFPPTVSPGQTFTVGRSGMLDRVLVHIGRCGAEAPGAMIRGSVYKTGVLLGFADIPYAAVIPCAPALASAPVDFQFLSCIGAARGEVLELRLSLVNHSASCPQPGGFCSNDGSIVCFTSSDCSSDIVVSFQIGNSYLGGTMTVNGTPVVQDMKFESWMK